MTTRLEAMTNLHAFVNPDGTVPPVCRAPHPFWFSRAEAANSGRNEHGDDKPASVDQPRQPVSSEPRCGRVANALFSQLREPASNP